MNKDYQSRPPSHPKTQSDLGPVLVCLVFTQLFSAWLAPSSVPPISSARPSQNLSASLASSAPVVWGSPGLAQGGPSLCLEHLHGEDPVGRAGPMGAPERDWCFADALVRPPLAATLYQSSLQAASARESRGKQQPCDAPCAGSG